MIAVEPEFPANQADHNPIDAPFAIAGILVIAALAYGWAVLHPEPTPRTMVQHLTFQTTKVSARVMESTTVGTCEGAEVWSGDDPKIEVQLAWTRQGEDRTGSYTACGADTSTPQDVWVTDHGAVASQRAPWIDHLWSLLWPGVALALWVLIPALQSLRERRWRRQLGS